MVAMKRTKPIRTTTAAAITVGTKKRVTKHILPCLCKSGVLVGRLAS